MNITSKTGDKGKTTLLSGDRLYKDDYIFSCLGSCEELIARLGVAKNYNSRFYATIDRFQTALQDIYKYVSYKGSIDISFIDKEVHLLDVLVVEYGADIGDRKEAGVPGVNKASAQFHLARSGCRHLERTFLGMRKFMDIDYRFIKYLNRLADVIYLMAIISEIYTNQRLYEV